jgi:hypothetical protein
MASLPRRWLFGLVAETLGSSAARLCAGRGCRWEGGLCCIVGHGFRSGSRRRWLSRHKRNLDGSWWMWLRRLSHTRCHRGKDSVVVKTVVVVRMSGQWV